MILISEPACLQGNGASGHQAARVQLETAAPPVLERGSMVGMYWRPPVPLFLWGSLPVSEISRKVMSEERERWPEMD